MQMKEVLVGSCIASVLAFFSVRNLTSKVDKSDLTFMQAFVNIQIRDLEVTYKANCYSASGFVTSFASRSPNKQ